MPSQLLGPVYIRIELFKDGPVKTVAAPISIRTYPEIEFARAIEYLTELAIKTGSPGINKKQLKFHGFESLIDFEERSIDVIDELFRDEPESPDTLVMTFERVKEDAVVK